MKAITRILLVVALGYVATGCWFWDLINGPQGLKVKTVFVTPPSPTQRQTINPDPGVEVFGHWQGDNGPGTQCGNQMDFSGTTDGSGKFSVPGARLPAVWN